MAEKHSGFEATGNIDLDTNDKVLIVHDKTPASAAAAGTKGEICWDASYVYICVATDSWKRVAIAAW